MLDIELEKDSTFARYTFGEPPGKRLMVLLPGAVLAREHRKLGDRKAEDTIGKAHPDRVAFR